MKRVAIVALIAVLPLGCSSYYSSESSMKTLTSPCRSSGSSKGDDTKKEAYRDDVRDFTAAYAAESADLAGFESGLAAVARRHGVTDWEADDATFTAIGAGLRRANVRTSDLERYEAAVGRSEPAKTSLIRDGYGS